MRVKIVDHEGSTISFEIKVNNAIEQLEKSHFKILSIRPLNQKRTLLTYNPKDAILPTVKMQDLCLQG